MSVLDKIKGVRKPEHWVSRFVVMSVVDGPEDWSRRVGQRENLQYHCQGSTLSEAQRARDYEMTNFCGNEHRRWLIAEIVESISDQPRARNQETGNNGSCPPGAA